MKLSLGRKFVLLIIVVALVLSGTSLGVGAAVFRKMTNEDYAKDADALSWAVAVSIDGDRLATITDKVMEIYHASDTKLDNTQWEDPRFEAYAEQFLDLMEDPDYLAVREELRKLQDATGVDCVYTLCPDYDDVTVVYIVDAAYDGAEIVTPGCYDLVEPVCYPYMDDLSGGFPAFISNTPEYGWMVTSAMPVYDSTGRLVCLAAVDLDMNDVRGEEQRFVFLLAGILAGITVMICLVSILYVKRRIVKPINMLSDAAGQYSQNQSAVTHNEFGSIIIRTGDELEILLRSMVQMEKDIDTYIKNLTQTREQLSNARQQADNMNELAHKDALTGIRNKLAYDNEIERLDSGLQEGKNAFGIAMIDLNFLKVINDTYGHEQGNFAIKSLCRIVCRIFSHSPVFRIGGDEFAVILRDHDYDHIEELYAQFNHHLEELAADSTLQPWEKVSASVGYALFDPECDHCADDVFKRADHNMYERKKAMKALRK